MAANHAVALVESLNHELRVKLLTLIIESEHPVSPKDLALITDQPVSNVSYHVSVLEEKGAVELVEEESVRGAVKHFYASTELADAQWLRQALGVLADQPDGIAGEDPPATGGIDGAPVEGK